MCSVRLQLIKSPDIVPECLHGLVPGDPLLDPAGHDVQVPGPQPLAVGQGGLHARLEQGLLSDPGPVTKAGAWLRVEQNLTLCIRLSESVTGES